MIVAEPADTPVTIPVDAIPAIEVLLLLQVPPVAVSIKGIVVEPSHTLATPVIVPASGCGNTVNGYVATAVLQTLVTE